jgi:hypothetical protein
MNMDTPKFATKLERLTKNSASNPQTSGAQQTMTKFKAMFAVNCITPKAVAKLQLLCHKLPLEASLLTVGQTQVAHISSAVGLPSGESFLASFPPPE